MKNGSIQVRGFRRREGSSKMTEEGVLVESLSCLLL